jgi:glycine/D-amino acid oxidase-like deaminating enzyme
MSAGLPGDAGRSWWLREALGADPGEPASPLAADTTADVVILGGGYTGMWTAYHLTELAPGIEVVILEQDICGAGASGRNGGFVNSFWSSLPELCEMFGDGAALRLCRTAEESVAAIGRFCHEHGVDAWFRADGELAIASSEIQVGAWADLVIAADRLGIGDEFHVLSPAETRTRVDSPLFRGGVFTPHGATVQPARLARGLRRVLLERGVQIAEGAPVERFGVGDPAVAETPGGTVRAGAAVIGLNAWAAEWRRFRRALMVRGSSMALTAAAPERLEKISWSDGVGVSNYREAIHYVRTTPDGRIAFGIGGLQPYLGHHVGPRYRYDERAARTLVGDLHRMFPTFADVPVEAVWGGPIDVAGFHLPFFGSLGRGNVHYGLGYTGNGVGPSHLGGRILALRALGRYEEVLELPLVDAEPKRFPPEPIRSPGGFLVNRAIRRKDDVEDRGVEPNPLVDFAARLPRRTGFRLGP